MLRATSLCASTVDYVVRRMEPRASCMLSWYSTNRAVPPPPKQTLEKNSDVLFSQVSFQNHLEPSSRALHQEWRDFWEELGEKPICCDQSPVLSLVSRRHKQPSGCSNLCMDLVHRSVTGSRVQTDFVKCYTLDTFQLRASGPSQFATPHFPEWKFNRLLSISI